MLGLVQVTEAMTRLGGVADARVLLRMTSRRKVRRAVRRGDVVRDARGKYALPGADESRRAAHRLSGVVTGHSAAAVHRLPMKTQPERPQVTVPRNRNVAPERRAGVDLRWRDIPEPDVLEGVLRVGPAVIDCARTLPFDEALAIADSALRKQMVSRRTLLRLADEVATTGREQALRVAREASGKADNPFESVLRAIALDVPGLDLKPHVHLRENGWSGAPDLVDVARRIVVEAESFEWHGRRTALKRDCERYNVLVLSGWRVVRFAWEHVMHDPAYVRACLLAVAERPAPRGPYRRAALPRPGRSVA
jgi:very-short-patch-repair endonuclease